MGMYDDEVSADNVMRKFESLSRSPADSVLEVTCELFGLSVLSRFRQLGYSTVSENVDFLAAATQGEFSRVWEKFKSEGSRIDEFERVINGPEFAAALRSSILQTQRTAQKDRLKTIARLLANGVVANDLEPEGFDDMARAAVELKSWDIQILHDVLNIDNQLAGGGADLFMGWQNYWSEFGSKYPGRTPGSVAGALGRLESFGFVTGEQGTSLANHPVAALHRITGDGRRFLERIQEIELS